MKYHKQNSKTMVEVEGNGVVSMKDPIVYKKEKDMRASMIDVVGSQKQDSMKVSNSKKSKRQSHKRSKSHAERVADGGDPGSDSSSASSSFSSSVYTSTISSHFSGDEEKEKHHIRDVLGNDEEVEKLNVVQQVIEERESESSSKAGNDITKKGIRSDDVSVARRSQSVDAITYKNSASQKVKSGKVTIYGGQG